MATAPPDPDAEAAAPSDAPPVAERASVRRFAATRHFSRWSSLTAGVMCLILLGLGTWQIVRLHQKNDLITHITAQLAQPERDLRLRPPVTDPAWRDLDYRRVVLQGDWLDLHQLKVLPRTYEGQNGYHLLVPLRLMDGQIILVNRGWVPDKTQLGPTSRMDGAVVAGIIRIVPVAKPFGMLDNTPARNEWAWPDLAAMARTIGVARVAPVLLYAERATDAADDYPIGSQAQLAVRNAHRQYALTWYGLALALLVIWLGASVRKPPAASSGSDDTAVPSDDDRRRDAV